MENLDVNMLKKLSYGLFLLTSRNEGRDNGCIINVAAQVTTNPLQIVLAVNKGNLTHDMIVQSGLLNLSVLTTETTMDIFERFGFQSGRSVDKFEGLAEISRSKNGVFYLEKSVNGFLSGQVSRMLDLGTHTLFVADVTEAVTLSDQPSLTYAYYHEHIKSKPVAKATEGARWVCDVCGYVYEGDEVPDDFVCPWCGHGKSDFVRQ